MLVRFNLDKLEGTGDYVATIDVSLDDDDVAESAGSVIVTLLTDTIYPFSYKVGTRNRQGVFVSDDDATPVVSISSIYSVFKGSGANDENGLFSYLCQIIWPKL